MNFSQLSLAIISVIPKQKSSRGDFCRSGFAPDRDMTQLVWHPDRECHGVARGHRWLTTADVVGESVSTLPNPESPAFCSKFVKPSLPAQADSVGSLLWGKGQVRGCCSGSCRVPARNLLSSCREASEAQPERLRHGSSRVASEQ